MATGVRLEPPDTCDAPPPGWRQRRWPGEAAVLALLEMGLVRFLTAAADVVPSPTAVPATLADVATQLKQRVAADGGDPTARQALATAYVRHAIETGDPSFYVLAERALDDADALAPDEPATLVARGTLALSLHDFDEARRIGERARRAAPTSAAVLGVAVDAAVELSAHDEAALQQAAGQVVDLELAVFEADHGDDPALAVELAERAYRARPDDIFAADALAWALHRAGRSAEAVPFVASALRVGSRDPVLRLHAASIHAAVEEPDAAREHLSIAATAAALPVAHLPAAARLAADLGVELDETWQAIP